VTQIREWLKTLNLDRYVGLFIENEVDFETLKILNEQDLKTLGLPFGPRKRLLNALLEVERSDRERRQITVLFCDIVGSTKISNRLDPEEWGAALARYKETCADCILGYEGFVAELKGDGVVAFFGFPRVRESEAERAIRSGLDIIDRLSRIDVPAVGHLQVRIGIATGVLVVSGSGKDAVGVTKSLAARLQIIARPGEIVVNESVNRLAGGAFKYEDLGNQALEGIDIPTRVFRVLGLSAATSRFEAATQEGLTPLVGRRQEMALLLERWRLTRNGSGQVVLISGEAGIGKSRMVSEIRERLEAQDVTTLHFQCSPFHINSAFHPCIANLERVLTFGRDESVDSKLTKLEEHVTRQCGRPVEDARYIAAAILSISSDHRYGTSPMSTRRQKEEAIRAIVDLTEAKARAKPTLMVFEDVHWADPSTREVLNLLFDRVGGFPLLVLITHRPEFQTRWPHCEHMATLDLSRLDAADSRAIVSRLSDGKALPEELIVEIIDKADGVPLFVEELTKSVLDSLDLTDSGDRDRYSGGRTRVTVPATLRDSLVARLEKVATGKQIAQIGATIGREFSYELLSAVAPMTKAALDEGLGRLTKSGLAFRRGRIPDATFVFKHALVQDAAYESLLNSRRQELHGAIARVLEARSPGIRESKPELLARHYTAAGHDNKAVPYWRLAGELAVKRMALPEAIAHLRMGLGRIESLPPGPDRDLQELELRTVLGPAVFAHTGWAAPEVSGIFKPAWALTQSLKHRESYLPVLHGLWVHFMSLGRLKTSIEWADTMQASAAAVKDEDLEICGHRAAMTSYFWMGELRKAQQHGDRVRALYDFERHRHIADLTNSDPLTSDGVYRSQYLWMLGYPDQARAVSDQTAKHARRRNHPFDLGFALTLGAQCFDYCGEPERLLRCTEEATRVGRERGIQLMSEVMAEISKGEAWLVSGRTVDSVNQLQEAIARLTKTGHRVWVPYLLARLGEALVCSGDLDAGLRVLTQGLDQLKCQDDRAHHAEILRLRGWMLFEQGSHGEAEATLRAAIKVAREQCAKSWELRTATTLARLLADRGDRRSAREQLAEVYGWFTEGFGTRDLKDARRVLDDLSA
jgi:class 3 adenylate cyclase/tetratricopeptide (TPR) repeat protein